MNGLLYNFTPFLADFQYKLLIRAYFLIIYAKKFKFQIT